MEVLSTTSMFVHSQFSTHITSFGDEYEHTHTYFELVYVLSGSIEHTCNNHTSLLTQRSFLLLRPNDVHFFRRIDADCHHRDIMVPKELFSECCQFLSPTLYQEILDRPAPYEGRIESISMQYFEDLLNHINSAPPEEADLCESLIRSVVSSLLTVYLRKKNLDVDSVPPGWFHYLLDKFNKTEYLQQGIPALISDLSYHPVYICRVFKRIMHCTMTEYLNKSRLRCAENYLRFTSSTISTIAEKVGFASTSYFNNLFKKQYGTSPHHYRLLLRQHSSGKDSPLPSLPV